MCSSGWCAGSISVPELQLKLPGLARRSYSFLGRRWVNLTSGHEFALPSKIGIPYFGTLFVNSGADFEHPKSAASEQQAALQYDFGYEMITPRSTAQVGNSPETGLSIIANQGLYNFDYDMKGPRINFPRCPNRLFLPDSDPD